MSNRQVLLMIVLVTFLSLTLAWVIERAQVRAFMGDFDKWWEARTSDGTSPDPNNG